MDIHLSESIWLNDTGECSIEHLAEVSGLSLEELYDLVDSSVIEPVDAAARPASFSLQYVVTARTARRLRDDFELDRHGLTLALTLLKRIEVLEAELRSKS